MTRRAGQFRPYRGVAGALATALLALVVVGPMVSAAATGTTAPSAASSTAPAASSISVSAALPRWTGGMDLYRPGVYTMQATWYWCTAANAQIMRNMTLHQSDHSSAHQGAYFSYMRAHDRYSIPLSDGTDPQGWADGLAHYVDGRYRLQTYTSFDSALHDAVTRMRLTGMAVSLAVMHGNHAWVLNGFTATADPAATSHFTVTSVRVTGPLYGRQSVDGYDMPPDTKLTTAAFRGFFTPFHYARVHMVWEGRYITIQPVPRSPAPAARPRAAPATIAVVTPVVVARIDEEVCQPTVGGRVCRV